MAERDESQERTQPATPKRLQEARDKGNIPRSRELATVSVLVTSWGAMGILGTQMLEDLRKVMRHCFSFTETQFAAGLPLLSLAQEVGWAVLVSLGPFLGVVLLATLLAPLALGGWQFSFGTVGFQWQRLDPLQGLQRIFAWHGLMELLKALIKFLLIMGVCVLLLWYQAADILALNQQDLQTAVVHLEQLLAGDLGILCAVLFLLAAIDVPFQLWNHARRLRMSQQEIKEEFKETEGKPEVKRRLRERQHEFARRRMLEAVPKADVVLTNPTHYAVVLRYDSGKMRAPHLVAKGLDHLARRIQEVANSHGVPVIRAPALARALYYHTPLDREIPAGLFVAVAHVLAYCYRLRQQPEGADLFPPEPQDLPVPEELTVAATKRT